MSERRWGIQWVWVLLLIPTVSWGQETALTNNPQISASQSDQPGFFGRFVNAYVEEFKGSPEGSPSEPSPARRALPAPWDSPPYPSGEYQGSPLIGVPVSTKEYPLMKALGGTLLGEWMRDHRLKTYGWVNGS